MKETPVDWDRKHYTPSGDNALLFYVVYGNVVQMDALSSSKYRCLGVPEGLEIMHYGPEANPDVPESFRDGYLWEKLKQENPELAMLVQGQSECLVLRGEFTDPKDLNYFRDTIGLLTYFLDSGGVAVFDSQMFKWWGKEEWMQKIFSPALAVPRHHAVVLVSDDDDGLKWFHTRGLRKYGRPDISIRNVQPEYEEAIVDLCNRFIEYQAFGGVIPEGKEVRMEKLPTMYCRHRGSLDDPDFNNVHIEVEWG